MIKSISIQNIQSHKDTTLELNSGINAIIGSSNNGKSAILRALYWVCYNRPLGIDNLLSHWAFDKKGNQISPMQVTVENNYGVVTRRRTKEENQYIVNGEELNVVKTDVPQDVSDVLKLSDTNIQKQQDAPFLLSLSSGQVAQYFNKTVRLDIIDKVLSNAESKRRKASQEIKTTEELLQDVKNKHEKYSWLEEAERLLIKYDNVLKKNEQIKSQIEELQQQIDEFDRYSEIRDRYSFIPETKELLSQISQLNQKVDDINQKSEDINFDLQSFDYCQKRNYDFTRAKELIDKIKKCNIKELHNQIDELQVQIEDYDANNCRIRANKKKMIELKKELPDICPLCGGVMKGGVCENE